MPWRFDIVGDHFKTAARLIKVERIEIRRRDLVVAIFPQPFRTTDRLWYARAIRAIPKHDVLRGNPVANVAVLGPVACYPVLQGCPGDLEGVLGAVGKELIAFVLSLGVDFRQLFVFFQ